MFREERARWSRVRRSRGERARFADVKARTRASRPTCDPPVPATSVSASASRTAASTSAFVVGAFGSTVDHVARSAPRGNEPAMQVLLFGQLVTKKTLQSDLERNLAAREGAFLSRGMSSARWGCRSRGARCSRSSRGERRTTWRPSLQTRQGREPGRPPRWLRLLSCPTPGRSGGARTLQTGNGRARPPPRRSGQLTPPRMWRASTPLSCRMSSRDAQFVMTMANILRPTLFD